MPKKPYINELKKMSMEERGAVAKIFEDVIVQYAKISNYLEDNGYHELANYVYGNSVKNITKTKNLFEGVRSVIPDDRTKPIFRVNALRDYMQKGRMQTKLTKIQRIVDKIDKTTVETE